ncbi:MAG: hypothetical protein PHP95_15190 [Desulfuromonadaceae bacterium]|nr:hypothetical protein [Desulfuromonadaceae bacterium]MDD2849795.1 hypothetical protein [Desulfuromonadaceae bacterium]MDD4129349.1 hypothetical protein [Desulfuromonadaceae bacterium]
MIFSVDRTRSYLKIEEPNLLSLRRSTHPIVPSADYCQGHLCDAFICVVHEYNLHRVYVALHDQQLKSNLIFIADPFRPDSKKLDLFLLKAHEFLKNIGFEMEEVNINFSTATREVIIKDIRVMREPSLALQLDAAKIALEGLIAEQKELSRKRSQEHMEHKAELDNLKKRLLAATAAQHSSTVELPAKNDNSSLSALPAETDELRKEIRILGEAEKELRLRLVGAEEELLKMREELGSSKNILKNTKDEARQARKELKVSQREGELVNEKLKSVQIEFEKARTEIEEVRRKSQETQKKYESALHDRMANSDEATDLQRAATTGMQAEINRLMAELTGKHLEYTRETGVLRAALTEASMSLSVEKAKNDSALQEMDALERNASAELKSLKKKVDTLSAEKHLLEKTTADIKIKAHGEIERQQQVNQSQRKAAIKKLHALKEEIRQLAEARAVIASPTGMALVQTDNKAPSLPAEDQNRPPLQDQQTSFTSDPFGSCETTEHINFLPDRQLKGIPYSFSTDVVEIYRSYNTIHAAPTGKQAQKCNGFVCLVTEGGQSLVYAAWLMNSSGEALVCVPERVTDGEESCRRMMREGISYFERIGFLIDRLPLETDPDKRQVQLDNLEIFCRSVTECAA